MEPETNSTTVSSKRANTNISLANILEVTTRVVKELDHELVGDSYENNILTNASLRQIITNKMRSNVEKLKTQQ